MSSTFIDYNNRGFEADDSTIEVFLSLIVNEIDKVALIPDWLREMRDEWYLQATAGFGFGVMPALDRYATDEVRRNVILDLSRRALKELESWGDPLPQEKLNGLHTGGEGATFTQDTPADIFVRTARYFIKLLDGKLKPWENDSRFDQQPDS